jgi:hypothetical protein
MTLGLRTHRCDAAILGSNYEFSRCRGWARHEITGESARYNADGDRTVDETRTIRLCGTHANTAQRRENVTVWSGHLTPENGWHVATFEVPDATSTE